MKLHHLFSTFFLSLVIITQANAAATLQAPRAEQKTLSAPHQTVNQSDNNTASEHSRKLSLNKATVRELIKIKGIKPNHAKALVKYRKKHGGYKSVEEIASVKGFRKMKPQTLKEIEEQLMV